VTSTRKTRSLICLGLHDCLPSCQTSFLPTGLSYPYLFASLLICPSVYLLFYLSPFVCQSHSFCASVYLSIHLSFRPLFPFIPCPFCAFVLLSICTCIHLTIYPFICQFISSPGCPFVHLSMHLFFNLSPHSSVYPFFCPSL
jgi:hypothetical protein